MGKTMPFSAKADLNVQLTGVRMRSPVAEGSSKHTGAIVT